ncbi:ABC transporter ATP-binding protein [Daejeonella sp.]|uniref:ATP-binding cassette domain-containing protein n=1 Tax=Daejeonella sp. TaxID=2805397 RepID=UPI0027306F3B|nr:ABC transporter ATP-binding protein [Daejeonella sp.]MDP2414321.1 ABC transporter ATP-binding protein [Daejeonella sp.]
MIQPIRKLFTLLSPHTKRLLPFVLGSILFIGLLEMLSVALLMPLLANDLISGGGARQSKTTGIDLIFTLLKNFHITSLRDIATLVVLFMVAKHILITILNYFQYVAIFKNDVWLRNELLFKYTNLNFLDFTNVKSAELIRNTAEQVGQISYGSLLSILTIVSETVVVFVLLGLIFVTLPVSSTILIISVFLFGLLPFYIFKKQIIYLGKIRFESISRTITEVQNIYSLYVEIKLYNIRGYFLNRVRDQSEIFTNAQVKNNLIANIPKGIIEIAAVVVILILIINSKSNDNFIPTIGIVVTSIFRIAPSFTRISSALTQLKFSVEQINVLYDVFQVSSVSQPITNKVRKITNTLFKEEVKLENVSFGYKGSHKLFSNYNLSVKRGDFVLLKGKSGKGKSTIVKIIMGLINPDSGRVLVDGKDLREMDQRFWHSKLGYVPQKAVIIEGSLEENICLGVLPSEVDQELLELVIKNAQLIEIKEQVGSNTLSQEGGSISGGQAQRIGIARALYREPEILFLDEPTSALDSKNASLIHKLLHELNHELGYTVIIITHSNEFDSSATKIFEI